jgi:hypothetical protein
MDIALIGEKFGRLTILDILPSEKKNTSSRFFCRCECGSTKTISSAAIKSGRTKSCGCLHRRAGGMSGTRVYNTWRGMMDRCYNSKNKRFDRYGGRGIIVADEWHDFFAFYKDMGERPENTTLDRIDNNGAYCKTNCRWATHKQQNRNRSGNRKFVVNGEELCVTDLAEKYGVKSRTLFERIHGRKMSIEEAIKPINYNKIKRSSLGV